MICRRVSLISLRGDGCAVRFVGVIEVSRLGQVGFPGLPRWVDGVAGFAAGADPLGRAVVGGVGPALSVRRI
jgi:hypothetical protein